MTTERLNALLKAADRTLTCFHFHPNLDDFCGILDPIHSGQPHPFVSLTDLLREVAGSQWQPIETAPRDGTEVLIAFDCIRAIGHWSSPMNEWHGFGWPVARNPTHWMPLPKPPTPERRKEDKP